ncbi:MAG TPA: formate dehydrogenase subunit gamma [Steroidobacteraceae bacterium]|nr:formate dehydrogenase subunit gamma [Steroidobacteraceae bacterium]
MLARIRHALAPLVFLTMLSIVLQADAQQANPNAPVSPDASAVKEQNLLQEESRIQGRIDIPDKRAGVLIQPAGREWDHFHEVTLRWLGAIVILGMIALLALAYVVLGKIRISAGRSGRKVLRFSGFERFSHWLTAVSFVVLGLTGLNITFGKLLLLPIVGPETFSAFSQISKYAHNFVSFSFVAGLVLIVALWVGDNIPKQVDIDWLKQGGGFIKSKHAPAGRFNAGEKMVFWFALGAGAAVIVSGLLLLFPFYFANIAGMQIAQVVHAIVAVLFIAVILAHIYIGTVGMEGAFEAMGTGEVDLHWAEEHHDLWLAEALAKERSAKPSGQPTPAPAK